MTELEPPATPLAATVLAHYAIEPAVETAREGEISRVDCQDERVVEHGTVEPVRDDQFYSGWFAEMVGPLDPFVDPGEAVAAP